MQRIVSASPRIVRPPSNFAGSIPGEPAKYANLQLYNQVLPPGGAFALDSGNFFFLLSNALAVNLQIQYPTGSTEIMNGIQAGSQIKRVKTWSRAQLSGTAGSLVSFWHGYEFSREDQTNFQSTIATISGAVSVTPAVGSANALTNHADVAVPATTVDTTIAANPLRKMLIIGSKSTNAPGVGLNLRIQGGAGAAVQEGIELQPGVSYAFGQGVPVSTAAYAIYNPAAAAQTYWWIEGT
jgi:hypothetical protein